MQPSKTTIVPSFAFVALAALVLAGCGTEKETDVNTGADTGTEAEAQEGTTGTDTDAPGDSGEAEFTVGDDVYTAKLAFCSLQGGTEALFHGTAYDASGTEVGYLDGDFGNLTDVPYGEVRIDFGATEQFESTDELIAMGDAASEIVVTDASETNLWIMGGAWDQNGTKTPNAFLKVEC